MYKIVIPTLNPNLAGDMVRLAVALAGVSSPNKRNPLKIVILGVVIVPEEMPLSQGAGLVKAYRTMLRYIPPDNRDGIEIETEVRVAREVSQGVMDQVLEEKADLLLLYWKGATQTPGAVFGVTIDALLRDPPCDIALARFGALPAIKSILIPVRGSGYNTLALRFANNLSETWDAKITVLHNLPPPVVLETEEERAPDPGFNLPFSESYSPDDGFSPLHNLLNELPPNARLLTVQGNVADSITREAEFHDLVMIGASGPEPGALPDNEPVALRLARQITRPLLVVKAHRPLSLGKQTSPHAEDEQLAETVDQWFAQNTFHYREFRTMSSLTLLKDHNDLSVSLVFPVYGKIQPVALADMVRRARFALMRDCALVDEIIISAPGAKFDIEELKLFGLDEPSNEIIFLNNDSTHDIDQATGPGEAIWYALRRVRGDIVVWADPSLAGFEAREIYGLVGPLLTYPRYMLSGGFFSNDGENGTHPVFNDLVELSVRPLLGGFFPGLAGIIDPLGFIGAARREHLERVPFFTGSGFLTGLLVDTFRRSGLMSIAQVDLGSPPAGGSMIPPQKFIAEVMSVLLRRLEDRVQSHLGSFYNPSVKTVHKTGGVYSLQVVHQSVPCRELPPPLYTPGYIRRSF